MDKQRDKLAVTDGGRKKPIEFCGTDIQVKLQFQTQASRLTTTVPSCNEKLAVAHGIQAGPLVRLTEIQRSILLPVPGSPVAPSELQGRHRP